MTAARSPVAFVMSAIVLLAGCTGTSRSSAPQSGRASGTRAIIPTRSSPSIIPTTPSATTSPTTSTTTKTPLLQVVPASASRGGTVSVTLVGCGLSSGDVGTGLFFHDSENLLKPKLNIGLYRVPVLVSGGTFKFQIPDRASVGRAFFNAVCVPSTGLHYDFTVAPPHS